MQDRRIHLKVKVKNLAAESKIIRLEEERALRHDPALYYSLLDHRKTVVRTAARTNHLAYGFIRGHAYRAMEPKAKSLPPAWGEIRKLVQRFGVCRDKDEPIETFQARKREQDVRFEAWLQEAQS